MSLQYKVFALHLKNQSWFSLTYGWARGYIKWKLVLSFRDQVSALISMFYSEHVEMFPDISHLSGVSNGAILIQKVV